ncbi:MAB_1171c family putative transporter [Streptomyces microflavus]|uniref:MAB_1171c family putative transporter n=1 Tax=Streptomyces microflavus TaxID=1919 RepID=UPI003814C3AE
MLNLVAIVTLLGGAAWTLPALIQRRFRDAMRVHLCMALFLMGIGNTLSQPAVLRFVDQCTVVGFTKFAYNAAVLVGLCLMVGFLRESPLNSFRLPWPWELGACLTCLAGMFVVALLLPPPLRDHGLTSVFLVDWRIRAFYNLGNFYLLFGYTTCAVLAGRQARHGHSLRKLSLGAITAGLSGLAFTCVFRFFWVNLPTLREPGTPVDYVDVFVFGQIATIVVCAGLTVPCVVSLVQIAQERMDCRAQYRGLEELWNRMMEFHPELALDGGSRRRSPRPANASAVYRRYVECRDGPTRLGPYLQRAADEGAALAHDDTKASARLVDRALHLLRGQRARDAELPTTAAFVIAPEGQRRSAGRDYENDLEALIRLSGELSELRSGVRSDLRKP